MTLRRRIAGTGRVIADNRRSRFGKRVAPLPLLILTLFVSLTSRPLAGEFHVDRNTANASDANAGSRESPWLTIQHAADTLRAGDICYVASGTYEEQVRPAHSGSQGDHITFAAVGDVTVRGFYVAGKHYVRICGFEITHAAALAYAGIHLEGAHGCEILDNHIHHTSNLGINLPRRSPCNHVLIRGNRLAYTGVVPTRQDGEIAIMMAGDYNRAEYNDISHAADFFNGWGQRNIIRNNYLHDCFEADFPTAAAGSLHIDGFQYYSSTLIMNHWLMENNYMLRVDVPDAHAVIVRDSANAGSAHMIFRGNAMARIGSYAFLVEQFDRLLCFNNTFVHVLNQLSPKSYYCMYFWNSATGASVLNNIFHDSTRAGGTVYQMDTTSRSGFVADYNLVHFSGRLSEANGLVDADPLFLDVDEDLHLAAHSPAVDSGGPVTRTVGDGSGTLLTLANADFFYDGWGISRGDRVRIGTNSARRVIAVDYASHAMQLADAVSWADGDPVSLAYDGEAPDRGAFEYQPDGYGFAVDIVSPASPSVGPVTEVIAAVANPQNVRYVVFYVDGVPRATVDSSPYSFTWNPTGPEDRRYNLEARAYALHASTNFVQSKKLQTVFRSTPLPAAVPRLENFRSVR